MAAAVLPLVAEKAQESAEDAKAKLSELAEDPVYTTGKAARKWGAIALGSGIFSFILAQVGKKMDQSYLNDITGILGIAKQTPPTEGTPAAPPPSPPPPPIPPQVSLLNQIVFDINTLGTTSAQSNVTALQDVLSQLWALSKLVYGAGTGNTPTQTPVTSLGGNLCIAMMQTITLIYEFEGSKVSGANWSWQNWSKLDVYGTNLAPGGSTTAYDFLMAQTTEVMGPYSNPSGAPVDWADATEMVSNTVNNDNYKITINTIAGALNASIPFDVTVQSSNHWGVLGTIVQDLSSIGTAIEQGAVTVVNDLETFGKDVVNIVSDIPSAIALIGKVLINLPRLTFDAVGYAFWWGVDIVCNAIWMPLVIVGAILLAYSTFAINYYPKIRSRLLLGLNARTAEFWNRFDKRFHTRRKIQQVWTQKSTDAMVYSANANPVFVPPIIETPSPPAIEAGLAAEAQKTEPEAEGGAVNAPPDNALSPDHPEEAPPPKEETPAAPPPPPPIEPTTTEQTEDLLGETGTAAPEVKSPEPSPVEASQTPPVSPTLVRQIEEEEEKRAEAAPSPQFSSPTITLVRTQKTKNERDREKAERTLKQMEYAFGPRLANATGPARLNTRAVEG